MPSGSPQGRDRLVICISGLTGTGKSTLGRKLAERYGLKYVSGGEALKKKAAELGYHVDRLGWWESPEAASFMEKRLEDHRFDREVDEWLIRLGREGGVVIDSWTISWLLDKGIGLRIWLHASPDVRAKRVAKRDGISLREALEALARKDEKTKTIYKRIYGFDLFDLSPYDLIIDTDNLSQEEVFSAICAVVEAMMRQGIQSVNKGACGRSP